MLYIVFLLNTSLFVKIKNIYLSKNKIKNQMEEGKEESPMGEEEIDEFLKKLGIDLNNESDELSPKKGEEGEDLVEKYFRAASNNDLDEISPLIDMLIQTGISLDVRDKEGKSKYQH